MVSVAASGSVFRAGMGHSEVLKAEIPVVMVFGDALHLSFHTRWENWDTSESWEGGCKSEMLFEISARCFSSQIKGENTC